LQATATRRSLTLAHVPEKRVRLSGKDMRDILAHVPEKWLPVLRQGHAQNQ
jgi:hypothetical protein